MSGALCDNVLFMSKTVVTASVVGAAIVAALATPAFAQEAAAGQTCTAMVLPSVTGAEGSATAMATSVRDLFVSYLTGPTLRSVPLEARLATQAVEEAKQKNCEHVLVVTMTLKRHSGGHNVIGAVGNAAGTAAWYIPGGGGTAGAVVRGTSASTAAAVSSLASSTRAKDELQIQYTLSTVDGKTLLTRSDKAKAASDREDLITPLVERAATAIAAAPAK